MTWTAIVCLSLDHRNLLICKTWTRLAVPFFTWVAHHEFAEIDTLAKFALIFVSLVRLALLTSLFVRFYLPLGASISFLCFTKNDVNPCLSAMWCARQIFYGHRYRILADNALDESGYLFVLIPCCGINQSTYVELITFTTQRGLHSFFVLKLKLSSVRVFTFQIYAPSKSKIVVLQ